MKKNIILKVIFIILIIFVVTSIGINIEDSNEIKEVSEEDCKKILEEYEAEEENLDGKKIALLGDSLISGYGNENGGLDYYLKADFPNTEVCNYAVGGSTITTNTGDNEIVIKNQIKNITNNPDIIIFNGGANDCIGYSMGFLDSNKRLPIGEYENITENTVLYDFESTILELKNKFPNADIFYVQMCLLDYETLVNIVDTDEKRGEIITRKDVFFADAKKICEKYDVSYFDVAENFSNTGLTYRQDDWIHLNDDGYKLIVSEIEYEIKYNWKAKFIRSDVVREDLWLCFRKKVNIDNLEFDKAIAKISADSQYWLYINGQVVVKQGGLKRCEKENAIYYDCIDITDYIVKGENTIAILTWYWGDTSLSYIPSGTPGLMFQAQIGDKLVISDSTWKTTNHTAFMHSGDIPNYRLAEYNEYYNANAEMGEWYKPEYDDSLWKDATEICRAGEMPFGELIKRDIPLFKYYDFKEYENMSEYAGHVTTSDEKIEMKIPYNAQFTPYLKIDSPGGLKITIKTDQYSDVNGDSLYTTYITKEGIQEYEAYSWINGEKVYYEIPAGVTILSLGYYESGYDTEIVGSFSCDDEFFNKLWQMSARTLYVNMRDTYMDCPTRERACWWGDASIDMMEAMYSLDTNSYALYEKGTKTLVNWNKYDLFYTVLPNTCQETHIPIQMLLGINSMYEYYEYTGNEEFLNEMYEPIKKYLNLYYWNDETNYIELSQWYAAWDWGDSTAWNDYKLQRSIWYYLALTKQEKMAEIVNPGDVAELNEKIQKLSQALEKYWTESGYKSQEAPVPDERANAVAVISGLADSSKYETISKIFEGNYQSSVFMEKYVLEAMCIMDDIEGAQDRIKVRYNEMVNGEKACSTLWENWNYDIGTKNHAWAGGPLIIMSKYFAGIEPLETGYNTIKITPKFGKLNNISSTVETIKGNVSIQAEKNDEQINLNLTVPTKTLIAVEKIGESPEISINNKIVYKDGKNKRPKLATLESEDEKYLYFYIEKGEYNIISY